MKMTPEKKGRPGVPARRGISTAGWGNVVYVPENAGGGKPLLAALRGWLVFAGACDPSLFRRSSGDSRLFQAGAIAADHYNPPRTHQRRGSLKCHPALAGFFR